MTQEEKIKAYDEALKLIKECTPDENGFITIYPNEIFPELAESEDERIRKWIVKQIKTYDPSNIKDKALAWLEKQGEQKQLKKIEKMNIEGTFINVDEIREDFVQEVYRVLDADSTNDRANQIIYAFDNLPTVTIEKQGEQKPVDKIGRKFNVGDIVQYITDSTDRRKIKKIDTLCNMYHTDSSPIMFEIEDEWKVVVNAEDIEQEPAEWSEEDIIHLNNCISYMSRLDSSEMDWLKSLKPKSQWKPSDKQMKALGVATNISNVSEKEYIELEKLYQDLKKLMEG